jgi:S1-C subfamily serine protease
MAEGGPAAKRHRPSVPASPGAGLRRSDSDALESAVPLHSVRHRSKLPLSSVVQVFTTAALPDYSLPWQVCPQQTSTGSGFAFTERHTGRRLIVTNAHVAAATNAVLRVQLHGSPDKLRAKVLAIGNDCDLAILELAAGDGNGDGPEAAEATAFWSAVQPVQISEDLPQLYEEVHVVGFPGQFSSICVTAGIVSRICVQSYNQPSPCPLLTIQIDAAINPGNSGGPAFDENGRLIGVAFLKSVGHDVDNTGYLIPVPVVENFLERALSEDGYKGMPCVPFRFQSLENEAFRKSLQMVPRKHSGVYIKEVAKLGALAEKLKQGDVLLQIDGQRIGNDMTVHFRDTESVDFRHRITGTRKGSKTTLRVLRKGKELTVSAELPGNTHHLLCPRYHELDCVPTFLIVGGLVFVPLTGSLYEALSGGDDGMGGMSDVYLPGVLADKLWAFKQKEGQQMILLLRVLTADCNLGYYPSGAVRTLTALNGNKISSMEQLVKEVYEGSSASSKYLKFKFGSFSTATSSEGAASRDEDVDEDDSGDMIVLDREEAMSSEKEVLATHRIDTVLSEDLRALRPAA